METRYVNFDHIHPLLRAFLAFNDYDYDDDETAISATSVMKPVHMIALERSNKTADREINIDAMIPSVGGTSLHNMFEVALTKTDSELWKALGVKNPAALEILTEDRKSLPLLGYNVTGKYDVLYRYNGSQWQLGDLKSMSVWGMVIDPEKKKAEWREQMSIYRYLNQDKDINDIGVIFYWFTDWSKTDARAKKDYPQSRIGHIDIDLWSTTDTELYLIEKLTKITSAMERYAKTGKTGTACSEPELWSKAEAFAYYKKKDAKRASKVYPTSEEAYDALAKDGNTGRVEHRPGEKTRCKYCAVLTLCEQGLQYKALGLVPE